MAKVERGVVKPPNQELQGLAATRSATPRCRRACIAQGRIPRCMPAILAGRPTSHGDRARSRR